MENKPILHNWLQMGERVWGEAYNDNRRPNGTMLITSTIVSLDREKGVLQTRNTSYDLGKEIE